MRRNIVLSCLFLFLFSQLSFAGPDIKDKPEVFVQMGHIENIGLISFTPDNKYILSGDVVGQAKLWDPTTGREIRNIDGFIIAFSSNRKYALFSTGKRDKRKRLLRVWDLEKNRFVRSSKLIEPIRFEISAISNDGKTALLLKRKTFILWDLQRDKRILEFTGHSDDVVSLAFSADSKYALSGSEDKTMRLWDVKSGRELKKFEGHGSDVSWVSFAPGGKIAASAGEHDETVRLWNIDTGREMQRFKGESKVYWLNFSPDGRRILAGSESGIGLWDIETGVELLERYKKQARDKAMAELEAKARIEAEAKAREKAKEGVKFEIGSNGQKIIVEEEIIVDVSSEELFEFEEELEDEGVREAYYGTFSPDGQRIVTAGYKDLGFFDPDTGLRVKTELDFRGYTDEVYSIAFTSDGKYLLSRSHGAIIVWDMVNGSKVTQWDSGYTKQIAASSDPDYFIAAGKELVLWDIAGKEKVWSVEDLDSEVSDVRFSPDGRRILTSGRYPKLWDASTGEELKTFDLEAGKTSAFSPCGKYIFTGQPPKLIEIESGRIAQEYKYSCSPYDFSPDGRHIAHCNGVIERKTAKDRIIDRWRKEGIRALKYSPSGKYLLTGSWNSSVRLWNAKTFDQIWTLQLPPKCWIEDIAFSPCGKYAAAASFNGTIVLLDVAGGKTLATMMDFRPDPDRNWREAQDWVVITPDGYFNASENGARYINVRIGHQIYSADQFYTQFYRPELVKLALAGKALPKTSNMTAIAVNQPAPSVIILSPPDQTTAKEDSVEITLKVVDRGGGIGDINVYLNDSLVSNDTRGIMVVGKEVEGEKILSFKISLLAGENKITASAFNETGSMQSNLTSVSVNCLAASVKPNLYALIVGIDDYKNKKISLKYSVSDAKAFDHEIQRLAASLFARINTTVLTSRQETTKENIQQTFSQLSDKVKPGDLFIFYNASHGLMDEVEGKDQYYLLTSNVKLLSSRHIKKDALSQQDLIRMIGAIPAQKKLIILDTCYAGAAGTELTSALLSGTRGLTEATAIKLLQKAVGSNVFSASSSSEEAMEGYRGHGLFTFCLLQGLRGKADLNNDGYIKIYELADYIEEEVITVAEEVFKRDQTPIIQPLANFPLCKSE